MYEEKSTLKRLKRLPNLFRKQDAEKVAPHTAMFLSRALQKGLIHRLNRGIYINSFLYGFPRVEEVACFIRPPAYVTCEWALNYHGISLQSPFVCTVVTLSSAVGKRRNIEYQDITVEFSKIAPPLFFGFTQINNFYMATGEKAILDTLYYRKRLPAEDELEMDEVDLEALSQMAERFSSSVSKRLSIFIKRSF